jgi:hypothetical protein
MIDEDSSESDARAEGAFREALQSLDTPGSANPVAARRRAGRRRFAAIATACVALAAVLTGFLGLTSVTSDVLDLVVPAVNPAGATDGWRTEYYRDITFQVPTDWGYAEEPTHACVTGWLPWWNRSPKRYVALGHQTVTTLDLCGEDKGAMFTEHVAVLPLVGPPQEGAQRMRGTWVVTRAVGEVQLKAVSDSRRRAQQIVDSATLRRDGPDAVCPPHSRLERQVPVRPERPFDLALVAAVRSITVCEYETTDTIPGENAGLLLKTVLQRDQAEHLLAQMKKAPVIAPPNCSGPANYDAAVTLELRLETDSGSHDMYVQVGRCADQTPSVTGGFDDGERVRRWTTAACRAMLVPPLSYYKAGYSGEPSCG